MKARVNEAIFVSNRCMDVLETELKNLEEPKLWKPKISEKYYYVDSVHMIKVKEDNENGQV